MGASWNQLCLTGYAAEEGFRSLAMMGASGCGVDNYLDDYYSLASADGTRFCFMIGDHSPSHNACSYCISFTPGGSGRAQKLSWRPNNDAVTLDLEWSCWVDWNSTENHVVQCRRYPFMSGAGGANFTFPRLSARAKDGSTVYSDLAIGVGPFSVCWAVIPPTNTERSRIGCSSFERGSRTWTEVAKAAPIQLFPAKVPIQSVRVSSSLVCVISSSADDYPSPLCASNSDDFQASNPVFALLPFQQRSSDFSLGEGVVLSRMDSNTIGLYNLVFPLSIAKASSISWPPAAVALPEVEASAVSNSSAQIAACASQTACADCVKISGCAFFHDANACLPKRVDQAVLAVVLPAGSILNGGADVVAVDLPGCTRSVITAAPSESPSSSLTSTGWAVTTTAPPSSPSTSGWMVTAAPPPSSSPSSAWLTAVPATTSRSSSTSWTSSTFATSVTISTTAPVAHGWFTPLTMLVLGLAAGVVIGAAGFIIYFVLKRRNARTLARQAVRDVANIDDDDDLHADLGDDEVDLL